MTITKRLLALLMALAMCLSLAACKSSTSDDDADVSADAEATASADADSDADAEASEDIEVDLTQGVYEFASGLPGDGTALTVNGVDVSNDVFLYWLYYGCYYLQYQYSYYGMTADLSDEDLAASILEDAQDAAVYYAVMRQICDENGVTMSEDQQAEFQSNIDDYISTYGEDGYQNLVKAMGSEEAFQYINTNYYMFEALSEQLIGEPTDADLEQYVTDNGVFSVKHILLMTTDEDITDDEGNVTQTADEYNAAQKALAEELLAQLNASDDLETLFDELMNEHSEDTGLASYPDGYTFDSSSSLVDGFREAALELNVGELSDIVETSYGYHIMLRQEVDPSEYHDDWINDKADAMITEAVDSAEVVLSDDISSLDLASFYARYEAYCNELFADETDDTADTTDTAEAEG
jgi:uncharacterized protein YcnI